MIIGSLYTENFKAHTYELLIKDIPNGKKYGIYIKLGATREKLLEAQVLLTEYFNAVWDKKMSVERFLHNMKHIGTMDYDMVEDYFNFWKDRHIFFMINVKELEDI